MNINDINRAYNNIKDHIEKTPLVYSSFFSEEYGNNIYLKTENLQRTGSFKLRGAYNKVCTLSEEEKSKGLIASSAGNHAQGVAYAGTKNNVKSTIVMPNITPLIKVESTRQLGAQVILHGDVYDEAYEKARALEKENNYVFIHPFDDLEVIAGQGTIGLEIIEDLPEVEYILVPIGGGGLISGIAIAAKETNPNIKIIGVEPENACAMKQSMDKKKLTKLDSVNTIAEGVAVKAPGQMTFDIVSQYVDDIITVSDMDIMESLLLLLEKHKLVAETAGATTLAALKKLDVKNKNIVSLISGGNIDVLTISELINKGLVSRGRMFCFALDLPHKPGVLERVIHLLAEEKANIIQLEHNQFKVLKSFNKVRLEVTVETNGNEHINRIKESFQDNGYDIDVIY